MKWISRIITLLVIVGMMFGIVMFARSRLPATTVGQAFTTYAKFRDASKLVVGSPVMIAGIRIGEVTKLTIEGRLARVDMRLRDDTDVAVDSFVTKRAPASFGDSYVEIIPASETAERLASGQPLVHVIESGSTDTVLRATARNMPKLEKAIDAFAAFMQAGRSWVNGSLVGNLESLDTWMGDGKLQAPLQAADDAFEKIEHATQRATDALGGTDSSLAALTKAEDRIADARKQIADYKSQMSLGFADTRKAFDNIDEQIDQASQITRAISNGSGDDWKGSLGRLVNDPKLADDIEEGVQGLEEATSSFDRFRAYLGVRFELNVNALLPRVYLTAEIRARNDKFYLIELQKGLLGGVPGDQLSDAAGTTSYTRTQSIKDELRFTAQFGKIFGPLVVRGGIKDSTFGMGADFMVGRLTVSTDLFGSYSKTPNLKVATAFEIFRSIYLVAGFNDILNKPGRLQVELGNSPEPHQFENMRYGRDFFLGGMLRFNDEDIATLLRVYGAALVGLL